MITQVINDDTTVKQLCEGFGCWKAMVDSMAAGESGVLAIERWVSGYFADGLVALQCGSVLESSLMAQHMAAGTIYRDGRKTAGRGQEAMV